MIITKKLFYRIIHDVTYRNIVMAYMIKAVSVIIGVVLVRAYMNYFQSQAILGIWYTILSIVNWLINFDLGIGQGMRNTITIGLAENDVQKVRKSISAGYVVIGLLSVVLWIIASIAVAVLDWNAFFGIAQQEINPIILNAAVWITTTGIILQMIVKLISGLYNAMGKTALTNALTLSTNVVIILYLFVWRGRNDEQNLMMLSVLYAVAVNLPYIIATFATYFGKQRKIRPSFRLTDWEEAKRLLSLSNRFFITQILLMVITVTNEAFITKLIGVTQVVPYQVYYKLFSTVLLMYSLLTNPVWTSITHKWQKLDYQGVIQCIKILIGSCMLFALGALLMCITLQPIINVWLGEEAISVTVSATLSFGFYTIVMLFAYALAAIANALSKLNVQICCYMLAVALKYPLCRLMLNWNYDWSMIVLVNALIMLPMVLIQPITLKKEIQKFKRRCNGFSDK